MEDFYEYNHVRIRAAYPDNALRALVSITLDNEIAIHDIKIIQGPNRLFVAMPSRKDDKGVFRDICHPISATIRDQLEERILNEFVSSVSFNDKHSEQIS